MIISFIGCGKVGSVFAKKMDCYSDYQIAGIMNRNLNSSLNAVSFIGTGKACVKISEIPQSDVYFIATSDDQIENACIQLSNSDLINQNSIVIHCSGAYSSELLNPAKLKGASVGSFHAMKSFANQELAFNTLKGTFCGIEGDSKACDFLATVLKQCECQIFNLNAQTKILYHAGAVIVCNYLTALIESGLSCFEHAGLERNFALSIIEPFIRGTIENNLKFGTAHALTGPIARGDYELVKNQYQAILEQLPETAELYSTLGKVALNLAKEQGNIKPESADLIDELFLDN